MVMEIKLIVVVVVGWVTNREYRLEGPYAVLSLLLLLICVLCGVIVMY